MTRLSAIVSRLRAGWDAMWEMRYRIGGLYTSRGIYETTQGVEGVPMRVYRVFLPWRVAKRVLGL